MPPQAADSVRFPSTILRKLYASSGSPHPTKQIVQATATSKRSWDAPDPESAQVPSFPLETRNTVVDATIITNTIHEVVRINDLNAGTNAVYDGNTCYVLRYGIIFAEASGSQTRDKR